MYNVYAKPKIGDTVAWDTVKTRKQAEETANDFAEKYPHLQVFIEYLRKSDGQVYYINPNGNINITGISWTKN